MQLHIPAALFALGIASSAAKPTLGQAGLVKDPASGLITHAPGSRPTSAQLYQMENTRYGMFIHFGINTFIIRSGPMDRCRLKNTRPRKSPTTSGC